MPEAAREIVCADAIPWLRERGPVEGTSVVTSLPDVSEVNLKLEAWRAWFLEAVRLCVAATPEAGAAVFFQSDIKHRSKGRGSRGQPDDAAQKKSARRPGGLLKTNRERERRP